MQSEHWRGLVAGLKQPVPKSRSFSPEKKKGWSRKNTKQRQSRDGSSVNEPRQLSVHKLEVRAGERHATEGNTMADVSFNKLASVVSCCSGPLMLTHMRTQEKNPPGTQPETLERAPNA